MSIAAMLRGSALVLLLLLGAPGPAPGQTAGELRVGLPWTPENLDPTMNLSSIRAKVGVSMFDSLVGRDADNRIVPQLAESWKALDDLTLQLRLRRGVVFHDAEPFNAEAVRFTFERVLDPNQKSPNRANVGEVARVDVVDDFTVNLVLRQPYAPLLNRLIDFPIVPPR
jgi:peptide/nickel transport system substrate-binding protein